MTFQTSMTEDEEEETEEDVGTEEIQDEDPVQVVEAVLFSAGRPLTVPDMGESTGIPREDVRKAVKKLRRMYQNRKTALEINKIGRKYSLQLAQEYNQYGMKLMDEDIPKPILKTAALIAYYQPVKQSELKKMIGSQIYEHVDKLQDMDLILVEKDGRTYSIRTSPKFQEYFGLEAKDRNELKKLMAKRAGLNR